jgi:hyperosmotically inducible protein
MTKFRFMATLAGVLSLAIGSASASAGEKSDNVERTTTTKKRSAGTKADAPAPSASADNTETNRRDRKDTEPTADQQKNGESDLKLTAEIRRSVVADKALSMNAHNVKIIAQDGKVTLKGPVDSATEKKSVEEKAEAVAGRKNVVSEIQIKQ